MKGYLINHIFCKKLHIFCSCFVERGASMGSINRTCPDLAGLTRTGFGFRFINSKFLAQTISFLQREFDTLDFTKAFEKHPQMPSKMQFSRHHPRLFISRTQIEDLKKQVENDPISKRLFETLKRKAEQFLKTKPVAYKLDGRRLLKQSRHCLEHLSTLSLVTLLTGDSRYSDWAIQEMEAVAEFPDWNPAHYLDVAEMTLALALGYDWLFDRLTAGQRQKIAKAILDKGINPSFDEVAREKWWLWWITGTNNWAQVCHAGVAAGALALAEDEPELAERVIKRAVENMPRAAEAYAPDGAYAEGPTYWHYGTSFQVVLIDVLKSALGNDYGLADFPGFLDSSKYILQMTGPSGKYYNYADGRSTRSMEATLFWFARRLNDPSLLQADLAILDKFLAAYEQEDFNDHYRLLALSLLWWKPEFSARLSGQRNLPLHWMAAGGNPVSVHRSAWNDKNAVFVAIKGGSPSGSHAHKDAGSFILEAGGVRWIVDPGMQEYHTLESAGVDLWNMEDGSQRWEVFRIGTQGHGVLSFDGAQQLTKGKASIVRFQENGAAPHTVIDLTSIYEDQATRVWRGVSLSGEGTVHLQDEWTAGNAAVTVRWKIITEAEITVDGAAITLSHAGKRLRLHVLEPAGVKIKIIDISKPPLPYDAENPNAHIIAFECLTAAHQSGTIRVTAALMDEKVQETDHLPSKPLESWSPPLVRRQAEITKKP